MDKNKTLIIVNFQYDYCNPKGTMYQNESDVAEKEIIHLLNSDHSINHVVFVMNWHEYYDESFKINGGKLPINCVQNSIGAGVSNCLINACHDNGINPEFIYKGDIPYTKEIGAFKYFEETISGIDLFNENKNNTISILNDEVIVCGICGDYDVKETLKNLKKTPLSIKIFMNAIVSVSAENKKFYKQFLNITTKN